MTKELRVSLIQPDTWWENPEANRADLEELISGLPETDLIVLPETFTTGFSSKASEVSELMNFTTHRWLKMMSAQKKAAICGSYFVKENNAVYNRLLFVKPDGETHAYDKRHLFSLGNEGQQFTAGNSDLVVEWRGWKIKPLICYDLRFPVWARNKDLEYDILIFSANWPAARSHVWNTLLAARAIENLSFVIGSNRIGKDGSDISYIGESQIADFKGNILLKLSDKENIGNTVLSKEALDQFRNTFPIWRDADRFTIH